MEAWITDRVLEASKVLLFHVWNEKRPHIDVGYNHILDDVCLTIANYYGYNGPKRIEFINTLFTILDREVYETYLK